MNESYVSSKNSKYSIEFNEIKSIEPDKLNINKFKNDINNNENKEQNKNNKTVIIYNKKEEFLNEINYKHHHISLDINNNINNEIQTEKNIFPLEENKKSENSNSSQKSITNSEFINFIINQLPIRNIRQSISSSNSDSNNSYNKRKIRNNCMICNEELKEEEKKNNLLECYHMFCDDCYYEYLKEKINSNFIEGIKCLDKDCDTKLYDDFIEKKLFKDIKLLDKYKTLQNKRQLMLDPNIQLCPFPDCDSYAKKENDSKYVSCIKYKHKFCFNCLKEWHGNKKCDTSVDKSFEKWRDSDKVKRCPKCKFFIEKNEGCNHITCYNCKYQFCWLCLGEYNSRHYDFGRCTGLQFTECSICSNRFFNFLYQAVLVLAKSIAFAIVPPFVIIFVIYYQFFDECLHVYNDCAQIFFGISGIFSCFSLIMCMIPITSAVAILMILYWPLQDKIFSIIK